MLTYFILGPIPWLMLKEFALTLLTYHILLKVSPSFLHSRLHKQFLLTACPNPFCDENGPTPKVTWPYSVHPMVQVLLLNTIISLPAI
jgi:hypothetical protein